jgi:hypothetical protein
LVPILLNAQDPELIINAGMVLSILGGNPNGFEILIKEKGIKACMNLLRYDDDQIRNNAAAVIWNLGHVKECKEEMAKYDVGKSLSDFLDSRDPDTIEKTLGAIVTVGSNIEIGAQFREAEGLEKLIPFLENHKYEKVTLYSIISTAVLAVNEENKDAIREVGALGPLIDILTCDNESFIEKSLAAQLNLSLNTKNRTAMRQLDAIPSLIDLLFHENPTIQQNAAGVLWNLANDERNKKLIREMGGLNALLALNSGGKVDEKDRDNVDKQKKNRKKIKGKHSTLKQDDDEDFASGKRKFLEDDDDDEVEEIKASPEEVRKDLSLFANDLRQRLELDQDLVDKLTKEEKRILDDASKDTLNWLEKNKNANINDLMKKKKEMDELTKPIISRVEALNDLEKFKNDIRKRMQDDDDDINKLSKKDLKKINDCLNEIDDWIQENPNATSKEIEEERERQRERLKPILSKAKARADLEDYATDMRKKLNEEEGLNEMLSDKEKRILDDATEELMEWLKENPNATEDEINEKKREIQKKLDPILNKGRKRKEFSDFITDLKSKINDENDPLSSLNSSDKRRILDNLEELQEWLRENPNATEEEIEEKKREFNKKNKETIDRASVLGQFEKDLRNHRDNVDNLLSDHITDKDKKKILGILFLTIRDDRRRPRLDRRSPKCKGNRY